MCVCVCVCVFTQPLHYKQDVTQGQFLSGVKLIWIQSDPSPRLVPVSMLKVSLSCYVPTDRRRKDGFLPFRRTLAKSERRTVTSRIWTRVVDSISYDHNHSATSTSFWFYISSSSSSRADFSDSLFPSVPIIHRFLQVLQTTPSTTHSWCSSLPVDQH